jgi:simple sugar transport system ATP-binding protein
MAVLELAGISKHFGAIHALSDVSMALQAGETLGLMGDNGAGKSTLVKIIAGNFPPTHGTMTINGKEAVFHRPVDARNHGVEIVYQDLALCDNMTAGVNVFLSRELTKGIGPFRVLDYGAMYKRAAQLFAELKSETRPRDLVKQMSGGQRQAVIARALSAQDRADGRADRSDFRRQWRVLS